jgi:hypothetical protein
MSDLGIDAIGDSGSGGGVSSDSVASAGNGSSSRISSTLAVPNDAPQSSREEFAAAMTAARSAAEQRQSGGAKPALADLNAAKLETGRQPVSPNDWSAQASFAVTAPLQRANLSSTGGKLAPTTLAYQLPAGKETARTRTEQTMNASPPASTKTARTRAPAITPQRVADVAAQTKPAAGVSRGDKAMTMGQQQAQSGRANTPPAHQTNAPDQSGGGSWANRAWGLFNTGLGVLEVAGGVVGGFLTSETGFGAVAGGVVALHGLDDIQAGARQAWTGKPTETVTQQVVTSAAQHAGAPPVAAAAIGIGVDFAAGGGIGGPGKAAKVGKGVEAVADAAKVGKDVEAVADGAKAGKRAEAAANAAKAGKGMEAAAKVPTAAKDARTAPKAANDAKPSNAAKAGKGMEAAAKVPTAAKDARAATKAEKATPMAPATAANDAKPSNAAKAGNAAKAAEKATKISELGPEGEAAYDTIKGAIDRAAGRSAAEVRSTLSPEQIRAGQEKPYLQRMFYGSDVENAVANDPAVLANRAITHQGTQNTGQVVQDFTISANGKTFHVDVTGPSESALRDHLGRPYITDPSQVLTYPAPSNQFLKDLFKK